MRINKKLVPGWAYATDAYGDKKHKYNRDKEYKEYIDCYDFTAAFAVILLIIGAACFLVWGFIQWTQVPNNNTARWNQQCDVIAGKQKHFIRHVSNQAWETECVIAPDWQGTRL